MLDTPPFITFLLNPESPVSDTPVAPDTASAELTAALAAAPPSREESVLEAVTKQYQKEAAGLKHDEDLMLKQKYGLVAAKLELGEVNAIRQESRR